MDKKVKLFDIDYDKHPGYLGKIVSPLNRLIFRIEFLVVLIYAFFKIFRRKKFPTDKHDFCAPETQEAKHIYKHFNADGFMALNDQLVMNVTKNALETFVVELENNLKEIPADSRQFDQCVKGLHRKEQREIFDAVESAFYLNKSVKAIFSGYFGVQMPKLVYMQIHINQSDDKYVFKHDDSDIFDDEMNFFHVDTNLNTLKAMVYLTDVSNHNQGAFEYVVASHKLYNKKDFFRRKIVRILGAYRRDEVGKNKLLSLPKTFRLTNDFSDYSINSPLGTYIYSRKVCCLSDQPIIIFDPLGIHRGGRVKESKRIAIQLVFCPDDQSWRA
jgi:hypothetical protein